MLTGRNLFIMRPHFMQYCQIHFLIPLFALSLLFCRPLLSIPVEMGVLAEPAYRHQDQFSRGIQKYHSSTDTRTVSYHSSDNFNRMYSGEIWFRADELLGDNHLGGIALGQYDSPDLRVGEAVFSDRYSPSGSGTVWSFHLPYFMFTYHYRMRQNRKLSYEIGGGLGFLLSPRWKVNGWRTNSYGQVSRYGSTHSASQGNIWRLEAGVERVLSNNLFLRIGVRNTFLAASRFRGKVSGSGSEWYQAGDGGLLLLSPYELDSLSLDASDTAALLYKTEMVKKKAVFTSGLTGLYFSVALRFP